MLYSPISLLVIDDNKLRVRNISDIFSSDYHLLIARNAEQGLQLALEEQPDAILLSVELADSDGFVLCHRLKGDLRTLAIPVLMVCEDDSQSLQERGFELGAADFIRFPVTPLLLRARVNAYTRLHRQSQQLVELVALDPLTGVANRKKFEQMLHLEIERCNRSHTFFCLLTVDIDDFKSYNEQYGYGKGNDCLITVAKIISNEAARTTDLVCRIDGEEFAILLPGTDAEGAQKLSHSILDELAIQKIQHGRSGDVRFLTVSIGAAIVDYKLHSPGSLTPELVLETAHHALRDARLEGRNRLAFNYVVADQ